MKIALCQINTTIGDFAGNQSKVLDSLRRAEGGGAQIAIFPELVTTGYPPRDLLENPEFIQHNLESARQIAAATGNKTAAVFGFVDKKTGDHVGRGIYNAAAFAYDGKIQFIQHKTLLPSYDVFDEVRHFDPAHVHQTHSYLGVKWGLTICEDIWSTFDFQGRRFYSTDPVDMMKKAGAEWIINISSSPFTLGKTSVRRKLICETARSHQIPVIYCNLVGGNDELVFDGHSLVANAEGELVFEVRTFREEFAIVDLEKLSVIPTPVTLSPIEEIYQTLVLGLRDYVYKSGFQKVLIGLSGGIDSAVVATLAVRALGEKHVIGVAMPSPYSSEQSLEDAQELAGRLGIGFRVIPIRQIYESYRKTLGWGGEEVSLAEENVQARIRGDILMALSNQEHALVLSTGNKSEMACGYCTLYGDLAGGMAVLSDLPKTEVYTLAKWMNKDVEMIPRGILDRPPSAELKPNQTDQDILPPYKELDAILKAYVEERKSLKEIVAMGFAQGVVSDVIRRVNRNEYKRRQAPLGIKVTSKAFGSGRRFPIAWKPNN